MNILVIKDNKPGHYNQTEGLLLALNYLYPNAIIEYYDTLIKNKVSRKILRFLLNNFTSFFEKKSNLSYLKYFYKNYVPPNQTPDLIISTGGNTSNINAWLSCAYKAKNILNGALRGLNENNFTLVTTVLNLGYKNQLILDVAPSTITIKQLQKKAKEFSKRHKIPHEKKYFSLLVGGNGAGYKYNNEFYNQIIKLVKEVSKSEHTKWLITTSRRTPIWVEKMLKKQLQEVSVYFVAFNEKSEKVLLPFLGLSEAVFVTEESASMISEAISSNRPVYTLHPNTFKADKNYQRLINKFEVQKKISRIDISMSCTLDREFNLSHNDNHIIMAKNIKQILE